MKLLKFRNYLIPLVLSGQKNSTWRLFDEKKLSEGDNIELREYYKEESFAKAKITKVIEKPFRELSDADKEGHEKFADDNEMYETFSSYYKTPVGHETIVKIIWFKLLEE